MSETPDDRDEQDQGEGGAVSEVANLGDGGPIVDDQSVAGHPDPEGGEVQEGRQGPNAVTGDETQDGEGFGAAAEERGRQDPAEAGENP